MTINAKTTHRWIVTLSSNAARREIHQHKKYRTDKCASVRAFEEIALAQNEKGKTCVCDALVMLFGKKNPIKSLWFQLSPGRHSRREMNGTSFMVLWMKCTWKSFHSFYGGHFAFVGSRPCTIHERATRIVISIKPNLTSDCEKMFPTWERKEKGK